MLTNRNLLTVAATAAVLCLLPTDALAEREYSGQSSAGRPPRTSFEAGPLTLYLGGRAQVQAAFLAGDEALLSAGDAAEGPGFRLRRARLGVDGSVNRARFGVEIDLLESQGTSLHEAYVGYDSTYALLYGGLVKVPLSRSALISSESLQMGDRAIGIDAIAPFQQLGMMAGGKIWDDRVRLLVGVYNGMTRGDTLAGGWRRIAPDKGNRFGGVAISARLDFEPLDLLGGGAGDLKQGTSPRLGIGGGFLWNGGETIESVAFSGDLAFKWYGVGLLAEFIQSTSKPVDEPTEDPGFIAETTSRAIVTQAGYAILANMLEVAFRFEMVDENTERDDEGDFFTFAGAVSGYILEGHIKVQLQYQHRMERNGLELDNDTFFLQAEGRF